MGARSMGEKKRCAKGRSECGNRTGACGTAGRSPALLTLLVLVAWLGLATCAAAAASAHPASLCRQGAAGKAAFVGPGGGGGGLLPLGACANADACALAPRGAQRHQRRRREAALAMSADAEARQGENAAGAAPDAAMQFSLLDSGNFKRLEQFGPLRVQV
jgi:hypothetical protein